MNEPQVCDTCEAVRPAGHEHYPPWRVWPAEETEADAITVRASDASDAAERGAARIDAEDGHSILRGPAATLRVKSEAGEVTRWCVRGEAVPQYTATPVDEEERSQ